MKEHRQPDVSLKSELALEVGILSGLNRRDASACDALGEWDYISHQVAASPFNPVDYMDRIDIFGYRLAKGYKGERISKYLVVIIKSGCAKLKDTATNMDYNQLMKYVDWICNKHAHGNYSITEAVLVAHSFDFDDALATENEIVRPYVTGHQAQAHTWENMRFATYSVSGNGKLALPSYTLTDQEVA